MILYIVKTVHCEDGENWCSSSDAIYIDSKTAFDTVRYNWGDIYEAGFNQYAVVLATQGGLYPTPQELQWYKWDKEQNGYQPCERPEFMDGWSLTI